LTTIGCREFSILTTIGCKKFRYFCYNRKITSNNFSFLLNWV